jgi:hypothetical protein
MGPFSGRPFGGLRAAKEHAERDLGVFPFQQRFIICQSRAEFARSRNRLVECGPALLDQLRLIHRVLTRCVKRM